jgi:hypothetical protein
MTYIEKFRFSSSKNNKMRSINDRDVLFFANESRDPSQSLQFFLTVHRQKIIPIKNK